MITTSTHEYFTRSKSNNTKVKKTITKLIHNYFTRSKTNN